MNDLIQVIKVLSESDLEIVNNHIDTLEFNKSSVFNYTDNKTGSDIREDVRTSTGTTLNENQEATVLLHSKINSSLEEYSRRIINYHVNFSHYPAPCGIDTTCWREGIQILQYVDGQEYKFHHDSATDPKIREYERKISVILYLNNDFAGGNTAFAHRAYKPNAGEALIFPSNWCYPHAGTPVTNGTKRVAVTWYYVDHVLHNKR